MHDRKFQQILPNVNLRNKGMIPAVPLGGHFKYLGKIFDFKSLNSVSKKEFEVKLEKILEKLSSLKIRSQTKLKIFSTYVSSQFNFELKIYNFTDSFLSGSLTDYVQSTIENGLSFRPTPVLLSGSARPYVSVG